MGSFNDSNDFERQLNKAVQGALGDRAKEYQRLIDSLGRRFRGRPVSTIKPTLQREWKRLGGSITDPELTEYATHISNGTQIKMKVGKQSGDLQGEVGPPLAHLVRSPGDRCCRRDPLTSAHDQVWEL
jgi:hypothetical protein